MECTVGRCSDRSGGVATRFPDERHVGNLASLPRLTRFAPSQFYRATRATTPPDTTHGLVSPATAATQAHGAHSKAAETSPLTTEKDRSDEPSRRPR